MESLEDRFAPTVTPGTVIGHGTALGGQEELNVNVLADTSTGTPRYSGTLSYTDARTHISYNATIITSVQIYESSPAVGTTTTNGYFVVTGYATSGTSTSLSSFTATGSLPFPANPGSTGGLSFTAQGPNSYNSPWTPWDAGENIAMTITSLPTTVTPTVTISSSANPAIVGQPVTFTVYVTPVTGAGDVSGSITLKDGTTTIGTATVAQNQAKFTTTSLVVGDHPLTATYSGNNSYTSATGTLTESVKPVTLVTPRVYLSASANPATVGDSVTFTVYVSPNTTTTSEVSGTVTLTDGSTVIGTGTIAQNQVKFTTSTLAIGDHTLVANYSGNSGYTPASGSMVETIKPLPISTPKVYVSSSSNPSIVGQPVTFTVYVSPNGATSGDLSGTVTLTDGTATLTTLTLVNAQAKFTTSDLAIGDHTITASYSGSSSFSPASGSMVETIKPIPVYTPKVYVSSSANPSTVGQPVTFTVYVSPNGAPSTDVGGTVTLMDGTAVIGTATLANLQAKFTTSSLTVGDHNITASYSGNPSFSPATGGMTETIKPVPLVTPIVYISPSANPGSVGQPVTFTVYVSPNGGAIGDVSGTVTLMDGATNLGTLTLASAQAKFTTSSLAVGTHNLVATYSGNGVFTPATGTMTETIRPANVYTPTLTLSSSNTAPFQGSPVTFTASLNPNGGPTSELSGKVNFSDGSLLLASVTIVNGQASFTTSSLSVGTHTIYATYTGNTTYTSASASVSETVKAVIPGSVNGQGTILSGQDRINLQVMASVAGGVPSYAGSLTFTDSKAGYTFNAVSITSVQIYESPVVTGRTTTNGYFVVTGTATLNGGTALYNFNATASLPFPANTGSTGGLQFTATGPNGFNYNQPWSPWDAGETVGMQQNT